MEILVEKARKSSSLLAQWIFFFGNMKFYFIKLTY